MAWTIFFVVTLAASAAARPSISNLSSVLSIEDELGGQTEQNDLDNLDDMVLVDGQQELLGKAFFMDKVGSLWPRGVIPYVIAPSALFRSAVILEAITRVMTDTKSCITFVPRLAQKDYIRFVFLQGCYSNVGRTGGVQDVSVNHTKCERPNGIIHELGHLLGFWHEHQRPDRDTYITVHKENIIAGHDHDFKIITDPGFLSPTYDFLSIMQYDQLSGSKNGKPTMTPNNNQTVWPPFSQKQSFSQLDLQMINMRKPGFVVEQSFDIQMAAEARYCDKKGSNKKEMDNPKGNCIAMADLNWSNKELIGKGKFGCVYRTDWYTHDEMGKEQHSTVAVKSPKGVKKDSIFEEKNIKSGLSHENIVNILGYSQLNNKAVLIFEYTEDGTLYDYIWDRQEEGGATAAMMMRFACEIAKGMEYLHANSYVHGDLALRNCTIDAEEKNAKVGDLGFYEERHENCYFSDSFANGSLPCPVRWMAPENLPYEFSTPLQMTRKAHTKSYEGDVWAFGVVLYELWTHGEYPFGGCDSDQLVCKCVLNGGTAATWNSNFKMRSSMEKLMKRCWKCNPEERPTFKSIVVSDFENLTEQPSGESDDVDYDE